MMERERERRAETDRQHYSIKHAPSSYNHRTHPYWFCINLFCAKSKNRDGLSSLFLKLINSRMIDDIDEFESIALIRFPANIAAEIDKEIKAEEDAIKARD